MALSVAIALVTVWAGIAISYQTDWPLGFFVGVIGAGLLPARPGLRRGRLTENPFSLVAGSLRYLALSSAKFH